MTLSRSSLHRRSSLLPPCDTLPPSSQCGHPPTGSARKVSSPYSHAPLSETSQTPHHVARDNATESPHTSFPASLLLSPRPRHWRECPPQRLCPFWPALLSRWHSAIPRDKASG